MTMNFVLKGKPMQLRGLFDGGSEVSARVEGWSQPWLKEMEDVETRGCDLTLVHRHELEEMLEEFPKVSKEVLGLLSKRETKHVTELQLRIAPISVRPYRYPHMHKN
ncbi:hypothetical protein CR513_53728, partial [Mucuna pruriens]